MLFLIQHDLNHCLVCLIQWFTMVLQLRHVISPSPLSRNSKRLSKSWYSSSLASKTCHKEREGTEGCVHGRFGDQSAFRTFWRNLPWLFSAVTNSVKLPTGSSRTGALVTWLIQNWLIQCPNGSAENEANQELNQAHNEWTKIWRMRLSHKEQCHITKELDKFRKLFQVNSAISRIINRLEKLPHLSHVPWPGRIKDKHGKQKRGGQNGAKLIKFQVNGISCHRDIRTEASHIWASFSFCLKASSSSELAVFIVCWTKTSTSRTGVKEKKCQKFANLLDQYCYIGPTRLPNPCVKRNCVDHIQNGKTEDTPPRFRTTKCAKLKDCKVSFLCKLCKLQTIINNVSQPVEQEEESEPFRDIVGKDSACWSPVREQYFKHREEGSREGPIITKHLLLRSSQTKSRLGTCPLQSMSANMTC